MFGNSANWLANWHLWLPWVLLALALVALVIVLERWLRTRALHKHLDQAGPPPVIDPDAAQVLAVLRSSNIVLDADGEIISASPRAYATGLVKGMPSIRQP